MNVTYAGSNQWDDHATNTVYFQIINVFILFVGLIYFLKNFIKQFFAERTKKYFELEERAKLLLHEAQKQLQQIQAQQTKLETTWDEQLMRAQVEAGELKKQLQQQADETVEHRLEEARLGLIAEQNQLIEKMKVALISEAIIGVEERLKAQLSEMDHKKLQADFSKAILKGLEK